MTWTITKTCGICEHYPYHEHCIGCKWDEGNGENTKWELKKNPIVIERAVLDKIKAEIESLSNANPSYWHSGDMVEREDVLQIIDKYKAESED